MEPGPWGDLVRSASGWERSDCWCDGHSSPSHYQDGTLYALLAAGALAFYVLYSAITMEAMAMEAGGGADQGANAFFRVKRNSASTFLTSELTSDSSLGLEEFQANIDSRSGGQNTWISEISDENSQLDADEEKCRLEMWRCLSQVVERGLHYIHKPGGLYRLAQKSLLRASFRGRFDQIWLNIPEGRQMKKCCEQHAVCRAMDDVL